MPTPVTPTICSTIAQPCGPGTGPGGVPCIETGAGVGTDTPQALANGVLEGVDFDFVNFEDPPSSADLPNDGVRAGLPGFYVLTAFMNFGGTDDVATATTFVYVNGVQVQSFPHVLAAVSTSQFISTALLLATNGLVQLFVQQDGALEGVSLLSASLGIARPCL
jgi:hypothetical protein